MDPLLAAIGLASAAIYALGLQARDGSPATDGLWLRYLPLFALQLLAALRVWRRGARPGTIVAFALVFRLLALAEPPRLSSDVYRYPWDGRVERAGVSPYRYPPSAPALRSLREGAIWPRINRKEQPTVYPPGAQLLFAALPYDVDATRALLIAADMLTILLLIGLLRRLGLDPARVVLYAWAPLCVYEIANNGHLEGAVLPLLVGAVLAVRAGRSRLAGGLLGLATAMKLYPGLAGAALLDRGRRRLAVAAGLVVAGLYAAYALPVGARVLGFLPRYVGVAEDHNIGLRALLQLGLAAVAGGHERVLAALVCALGIVVGAVAIARWPVPIERRLRALAGLHLLALPTALHPWYALWMLPWLCVHPGLPWLWLIGALPLSYLKYGTVDGTMPGWVRPLEFGPPLLWLAAGAARALWRRLPGRRGGAGAW